MTCKLIQNPSGVTFLTIKVVELRLRNEEYRDLDPIVIALPTRRHDYFNALSLVEFVKFISPTCRLGRFLVASVTNKGNVFKVKGWKFKDGTILLAEEVHEGFLPAQLFQTSTLIGTGLPIPRYLSPNIKATILALQNLMLTQLRNWLVECLITPHP